MPKPKEKRERESYANFNLSEKVRLVDEYLKIPEKLRNLTTFARHHGVKRKTFNTWVDNRRAGKLVYAPEDIKRNLTVIVKTRRTFPQPMYMLLI